MPRDWEQVRITLIRPGPIPTSSPCGNTIPDDDRFIVSLPAAARSVAQTHYTWNSQSYKHNHWMPPVCCLFMLQVYGPFSSSVSGEGCELHPTLWIHTLSGCQRCSKWSSQCYSPCGLCEIHFPIIQNNISVAKNRSQILLSVTLSVSLAPSLIILRLPWCHDTPQWRCSVQEIRLLTAEDRPMSAIAATRGQRVWPARQWATPAAS